MSAAVELIGGGKSRGTRADDGDLFACSLFGRLRCCPALLIGCFDDIIFIGADGDRITVSAAGARLFTQSRTHARGELGEAVGHFQTVVRLLPRSETDEVVPLGDQVIQRTARHHAADRQACLTERYAAVHTPLALMLTLRFTDRGVELVIVFDTFFHGRRGVILSCIFHKSVGISHTALLLISSGSADRRLRSWRCPRQDRSACLPRSLR